MEPKIWTDERIDDMVARSDSQFELLRNEIHDTRGELRSEIKEVRGEIHVLRGEMHALGAELREEMRELRREMVHGGFALFSAMVVMAGAMIAQAVA